jgi:hypothetical protein
VRKGTHDYYNDAGLATVTWEGQAVILKGDANMRPEDADRAARAVRTSIEQLLDAASGKIPLADDESVTSSANAFDVCTSDTIPAGADDLTVMPLWVYVAKSLPVPGMAEGAGALPLRGRSVHRVSPPTGGGRWRFLQHGANQRRDRRTGHRRSRRSRSGRW